PCFLDMKRPERRFATVLPALRWCELPSCFSWGLRLWANRVILTVRRSLPVHPDKQTYSEPVGTSHLGQKQPSVRWADQSLILLLRNGLNRTASLLLRRTTLGIVGWLHATEAPNVPSL